MAKMKKTIAMMSLTVICSILFVTAVFAANSAGYDATISSGSIAVLSTGDTKMERGYHSSIWRHTLTGTSMYVETEAEWKVLLSWKTRAGYNTITQNTVKGLIEWDLGGKYEVIHTWSRVSGGTSLFAEFGYYNW